jgi:ferredoxin
LNPVDEELMEGMGNCYSVCGEGFEETVRMVAGSRGRSESDVKDSLRRIAGQNGGEEEYKRLRARLPAEFPF